MNWLEGVATYLDTNITEVSFAADDVVNGSGERVNMFVNKELPDSPDMAFRLINTGGFETVKQIDVDEPNFQIIARFPAGSSDGLDVCEKFIDTLNTAVHVDLADGTRLALAYAIQSDPIFIGNDENRRPEWSINFAASIQRPSATVVRG